jgi:hypothetical protein
LRGEAFDLPGEFAKAAVYPEVARYMVMRGA